VRSNEGGKLALSVYGKPCAIWVDPVEKKPMYHFLPGTPIYSIGTFGCNFSCEFCQNYDISQAPHEARKRDPQKWQNYFKLLLERTDSLPPQTAVQNALVSGCRSLAFTYNEPTIFTEYALDIMAIAKKKGLKGVYVTNGYESKECWDAVRGFIDAANIDLKAYNQNFYSRLCKVPDFEPVKDSIKYAKRLGIWVEVTTLIIPDWNDNPDELRSECEFLASIDKEMPLHLTAYHPDYRMLNKPPTPPSTLLAARKIALDSGLKHVYCGNIPSAYSDYETTFCPKCSSPLIKRLGFSVIANDIKDGKCKHCKYSLKGVWK
jgi:pyruvate formate lyase activating enzyme